MDMLNGRRKRGAVKKPMPMQPVDMDEMMVRPGTSLFGQRAAGRKEKLEKRRRAGDLRVKTAYGTAKAATKEKNRYLQGD